MDKTDEEIQELTKLFREITALFRENMSLFRSGLSKGFGGMELTAPQGMLIGILGKYGQMKISDLSEKLGLSNSTVSGIIDRLEKPGIVERIRSLEDKRVVYAKLSERFEEMHKDIHKNLDERLMSLLNKGTREDLRKIIDGLNALKKLLSV